MVVRYSFLIFLLMLGAGSVEGRTEALNQCLSCHEVHYPQRGDCVDCHRGNSRTTRLNIAHHGLIEAKYAAFTLPDHPVTQAGEQLLKEYACRRCHVSAGKGNSLAANLDLSQQDKRPDELDSAIQYPVLFMPQFYFDEDQRVKLINAILAGARQVVTPEGEIPQVIHFENTEMVQERQFEKHCGTCHRSLTDRYGGLGSGLIGPNLSGLFSQFYPRNFGREGNQAWTPESLKEWLKNPRKIRPDTQMAPIKLTEKELLDLIGELGGDEQVNATRLR